MPSFGPPPIEVGMGSNAANARRPARNPPICACHAIACSTPAMLIELQWPPPEAQGRVIGPERPTRLPAEAVERGGREPTLGPPDTCKSAIADVCRARRRTPLPTRA
jgi:hypothetical protein